MKFITLFRIVQNRKEGSTEIIDTVFETIVNANLIVDLTDRYNHLNEKQSGCYVSVQGSQCSKYQDVRSKEGILELIKNTPDLENI